MAVEIPTNLISETIREVAADAPSFLGIGLETAVGAATGAGGVGLAFGAYKLLKTVFRKDRKQKHKVEGGEGRCEPQAPFPRRLDEARQLRQLRSHVEGRSPEYDATVGRFLDDEMLDLAKHGDDTDRRVLQELRERLMARVDATMPPSIKEYI